MNNQEAKTYTVLARKAANTLVKGKFFEGEVDDLIQAGLVGLLTIGVPYDPAQGHTKEDWAYRVLHFAMLDYLRSLDPLSRAMRDRITAIKKVEEEALSRGDSKPTLSQIAFTLELPKFKVAEALQVYRAATLQKKVDAYPDAEDDEPLDSVDPMDQSATPEVSLELKQKAQRLVQAIRELDPRLRTIMFYTVEQNMTQEQIGLKTGLGASMISRLMTKATEILAAKMKA